MQWMLHSHCDPKIDLSRKRDRWRTFKMNLWGGCTPDSPNSPSLFTAETQIQVSWTATFLVCALTLSHFIVFSAAAAVPLLGSVTWPLSALLLPLLVKLFLALIPEVLSKVMNHNCTSESLLTNETSAPNSAVLSQSRQGATAHL